MIRLLAIKIALALRVTGSNLSNFGHTMNTYQGFPPTRKLTRNWFFETFLTFHGEGPPSTKCRASNFSPRLAEVPGTGWFLINFRARPDKSGSSFITLGRAGVTLGATGGGGATCCTRDGAGTTGIFWDIAAMGCLLSIGNKNHPARPRPAHPMPNNGTSHKDRFDLFFSPTVSSVSFGDSFVSILTSASTS